MALDGNIKKVMVIGSGPIVIGQAAEFDYAGTQACRALREDGVEIILVNSNPATIMTDKAMADKIYIEPLTTTTVERVIEKERPDAILAGLGGQTGLNLCMKLAKSGALDRFGVKLLGVSPEAIDKAEDRKLFKETMESIGQPVIPSVIATETGAAEAFAAEIGYPVIVRPAFTLGGTGGGIANDAVALREIAANGLRMSPIRQILVERSVAGWKEIEFEVMRDNAGNVITVCSMENFDPVGIHTGDSIVIAPAVTLSDKEYQMLRTAALDIITALDVKGGCNCQFALDPDSFDYAVIEVNPRVSRSSALASKATGYPIAKVAAKIALGYNLDEIVNAVTGETSAAFEPALDYVAVKFPKWPFDKFVYAKRELGTQMKATGEVMAIADSFEAALMKAVRGAELGVESLYMPKMATLTRGELIKAIANPTDERLFAVYEAIKRGEQRGLSVDEINRISKIDRWFLYKLKHIADYELSLSHAETLSEEAYLRGKALGYTDRVIKKLTGQTPPVKARPKYRMVDTCAAEFAATTPYFYGVHGDVRDEAADFIGKTGKQSILILGSGPIRIGQGIEFDYAGVHCAWALRELGYEVVIVNNNPETVSTDFDTADRLYFEPLNVEDVMGVIEKENPVGVVAAFGGGTAIKLTQSLSKYGVNILGTTADMIDICEERHRFDKLLTELNVNRPKGFTATTLEGALNAANKLGYPVLMRPSYVLGGQNMIIAFSEEDIREYMDIILRINPGNNVLIDKYLSGIEVEVDAICDGEDILMPGIMEHVERTGVHSGDSIAMYPAPHVDDALGGKIKDVTRKICLAVGAKGLINIQYIVYDKDIYVIEVNPRASRTVPYLSKVVGLPICDLATRTALGEKLRDMGCGVGLRKKGPYKAVKVPVFSFEKLVDVDTQLGPEMKSTGEALGIGRTTGEALYKGFIAAGYKMCREGGLLVTVRDSDKEEVIGIVRKFYDLGFPLYATRSTGECLRKAGFAVEVVSKIHKAESGGETAITLLESGKVSYVISTSTKGRDPARDGVKMRRLASALGIPCLTSLDTANAIADCLVERYDESGMELIDTAAF